MTEQTVECEFRAAKRNKCVNTSSRFPINATCLFASLSTLTKPTVPSPHKPHLNMQTPLRASGAMFIGFIVPSMTTYAVSPPLAGESSITFDLSGPLLVLEINDLKGQAV